MTYDVSETLAPKSDQLDAVDLLDGPRIFTVQETVVHVGAEQPVSIKLAEFPRVWRPSKNMRRILAFAWGRDSRAWAGKQMELFCDPTVKFGGDAVGGTRINALSHIGTKPLKIPLLISKGKTAVVTVQPLKEAPKPVAITDEQVADLITLMDRKGSPADKRVAFAAWATKRPVDSLEALTVDELQVVAEALNARPDATQDADDEALEVEA